MSAHRWLAPLVGLSLTVGGTTAAYASPPRPTPHQQQSRTTVTLITGDQVQVSTAANGKITTTFTPGRGSTSDGAVTSTTNGHTYVVPSSAEAGIRTGRLDRSLFDITALVAQGATDSTPVILRYSGSAKTSLGRARSVVPGTQGGRVLNSLGARAARVPKANASTFWRSLSTAVTHVSLDHKVTASLDQSVPQIGAPAAWQRSFTGKGVKVAILDTGIDPTHPDFAGRIGAAEDFSGSGDVADHFGHGTHVASIAAGSGAASGGKYRGVAPDATLLNAKVLDDSGAGYDSGIIAGMEWAAAQGAAVANLSLGGDPTDGTDELSLAVNRITEQSGMLFVVAAGNCFSLQPGTVSTPAAADKALAVGNLQRDGSVNDGSCRGPRKRDHALKPEISAPGTDIVAARAAGTDLGTPVGDSYTTLTGTSMATPHVAGTAALIAQAHPDWKADTLKTRLISTADPQHTDVTAEGAGRVDADQSTATDADVDTGVLDLGTLTWPYPTHDVVTRELTYRNPTAAPVTLQLSTDLTGTTLSATQLVVPANGDAKVTASTDRATSGIGLHTGRITATAAGADPLVTVIGWYAEPESVDLTVKVIGRDGKPADSEVFVNRGDGPQPELGDSGSVITQNGVAKLRVPPGRYDVSTFLFTAAGDAALARFDLMQSAEFDLRAGRSVVLDARQAQIVDLKAAGTPAGTSARSTSLSLVREVPGLSRFVAASFSAPRVIGATRTAPLTTGTFEVTAAKRLEQAPYRTRIVGGAEFTALDFYFGPRFTGPKELQVFDGGTGTASDLAGTAGKLVLLRSDGSELNGVLTKRAEDAGAAAVMFFDPAVAGDGAIFPYWAYDGTDATIPAMRISRVNANRLLARPTTVRVTGQAVTPYVYDLAVPWSRQVPAKTDLTFPRSRFATVDDVFGTQVAGTPVSESRDVVTPAGAQGNLGSFVPFVAPAKRTSYVLAGSLSWSSTFIIDNGNQNITVTNLPHTYQPGLRTTERWGAPIMTSTLPDGPHPGVFRTQEGLDLTFSTHGHGADQFNQFYDFRGSSTLVVHRNGSEIVSTTDLPGGYAEVPAEAADYTVDLVTKPDPALFRYSTTVVSQWKFRSLGKDEERMPMVLADLDVPQADALGRVPTGKPVTLTLGLRHQYESGSTAAFARPTLEISYDGKHWTALSLRGSGTTYRAELTPTANQSGKAPSLRLTVKDADGNSLRQTITAAFGLK